MALIRRSVAPVRYKVHVPSHRVLSYTLSSEERLTSQKHSRIFAAVRPRRILHVIDSLGEGGAEQNLLTLVRNLRGPRCEHWLAWLYDDPNTLLEAFRPHVARLIPLHSEHGFGHLSTILQLSRTLRADPPDLVHGQLIRAQLVARAAATLAGRIPTITTWQCVSYRPDMFRFGGAKGLVYREVTRGLDILTGLGDRKIIAVSQEVATENAKALAVPPGRVAVNYNAFDSSRVVDLSAQARAELAQSLGIVGRGPILLSVGRLTEQKRHDITIAAMPQLVSRYPGIVLLIAGGGHLHGDLTRQIEVLGVHGNVRLLGPRRDVPELLQLADAFVLSSEFEGNSVALLEAVVAGLPVVTARTPSSLEVVDGIDSARFFEPLNANSLARSASDVIEHGAAMRARAHTNAPKIRGRFSAEVMAEGFWSVAERAVDGQPS